MNEISKNAQTIADVLQSLEIKASYELMCKLVACIEILGNISKAATQLTKENEELKKALNLEGTSENIESVKTADETD